MDDRCYAILAGYWGGYSYDWEAVCVHISHEKAKEDIKELRDSKGHKRGDVIYRLETTPFYPKTS